MAGIALVLDLLKRKQSSSLHSHGVFSAAAAASAAATVYVAAGKPLASRFFFGGRPAHLYHLWYREPCTEIQYMYTFCPQYLSQMCAEQHSLTSKATFKSHSDGRLPIGYCDAGAALSEDYIPNLLSAYESILHHDSIIYRTKEYPLELKPLFSAFRLKSLAITSIRSFLLFYLPLLEPRPPVEDDDFLKDELDDKPDFIVPFQNSVKQILRETTVVTTRRFLERIAVYHVSQRMAWKLLKDVSKSAKRKALRGMPTSCFVYSVSRTTFRGHMLGVAASWVVQIVIDFYRCFIRRSANDDDEITDTKQKIGLYGKKVCGAAVKCSSSLVFASIGAGIGALFHPSTGQWIGCALGDYAGPIIIILCFEKLHLEL